MILLIAQLMIDFGAFESHFKRNYIHVIDIARVFLHGILNHKSMVGEIYNVGLSMPMFQNGNCVKLFPSR